jgi:hypothetical protein
LLAAVSDSDPNEARRDGGSENEVQKIFVVADENVAFGFRIPEYLGVGSLRQLYIQNVFGVATRDSMKRASAPGS